MAKLSSAIWANDHNSKNISFGWHYKETAGDKVGSLHVLQGEIVTFYQHEDRTGKKSYRFYEGVYHDLSFYNVDKKTGAIHVEKTELRDLDLVEVGWYDNWKDAHGKSQAFYQYLMLPIGDRKSGDDFPNDHITYLKIPFGVQVEVFNEAGFRGGSLIFTGEKQGTRSQYDSGT